MLRFFQEGHDQVIVMADGKFGFIGEPTEKQMLVVFPGANGLLSDPRAPHLTILNALLQDGATLTNESILVGKPVAPLADEDDWYIGVPFSLFQEALALIAILRQISSSELRTVVGKLLPSFNVGVLGIEENYQALEQIERSYRFSMGNDDE